MKIEYLESEGFFTSNGFFKIWNYSSWKNFPIFGQKFVPTLTICYVIKNYNRSGIWFASHLSPRKPRILFLSTRRGCFWHGILHICFPDFSNSRNDLRMIGPEIRFTLLDLGSASALLRSPLGLRLWSFALVKQ